MTVRKVLVVCSGNTCRSPMATAMLRHLWQQGGGSNLELTSAGTSAFPGMEATEHAVAAMKNRGLDIGGHRSQAVSDVMLDGVDLVLTMTERHKEYILMLWPHLKDKVHTLGDYAGTHMDVSDPFGGNLAQYEATANDLETTLKLVVDKLRKEGSPPL